MDYAAQNSKSEKMKLFTTRCLIFVLFLCSTKLSAQTFSGSNPPDTFQDFAFTIGSSSSNLSIVVPGSTNNFSHLLLKKGAAPSVDNYDFIAVGNGQTNFINLQAPEFSATNYVLRVYTPTNSLAHDFTVTINTNLNDFRGFNRPATKALETQVTGTITSNSWQYFRIDVPTNLPGWRVVLYTTNLVTPDLYVQTNLPPASTNYWKRSTALNPDTLTFTNNEAGPGPHFVGVFLPGTTNIVNYTLTVELSSVIDLTWDPGLTHLGTQVYLNTNQTGGDYYFRIVAENTALGAWRTALNVLSGEAQVYMLRGALPAPTTATYKSERVGSDGFVIPASAFKAGEEWFLMIRAQPGSEWNLVTGEPFVLDLGTLTANGSSGSSNVVVGAEGMRFFKTTVPLDTLAWRLWLNGLTNSLLVKKGGVPVTGATDLSQNGQMLVVPTYLIGGQLYFVGISGVPGASVQLDSRQHTATDINFQSISSLSVTGFPYASFRAQVPIDQLAWQISVIVSNGNPNVAVRRNFIPNEFNNDAYSEVPGAVTDSISLVPSTLSDGTFYITVYGTNNHGFGLQTGPPVVTDINFSSSTLNDDPNRAGWRYFRVTDVVAQLGALGWDLFLSNSVPGTRIGLRRNAVPSLWNRRNNGVNSTAGSYDVLSVSDFLQRPAHQADVWYVGVYNTNAALGAFTLITQPLVAETVGFANAASSRMNVPTGKWQFFHYVVPSNTFGWDLRFTEVSNGSPRIVVRRDQLPTAWTNLTAANSPWTTAGSSTTFPSGNQWRADRDWTRLAQSPDGLDEIGRVHAMGMGLPLEPGTYYVGVIDVAGSNSMSYTLTSRGIGPGYPIPIADLNYSGGSASGSLPPREAAYYRVIVPTNVPSWKIKLDATSGDVLLIVMTNRIPNVDSGRATTGKLMQKIDNEHYVLLPPDGRTTLVGGTYFLAVVSEGVGSTGARIGSGNATYTLTSEGALPVQHLGTLTSAGADITQVDSLEGGEVKAYTFTSAADTLAMEIWLEDRVGNPVMVAQFDEELPDPGQMSDVVTADLYGNEGGTSGAAAPDLITCANCEGSFFSLVVKARGSGMVYSNASYTLRIHSVGVNPLPFDGGSASVVAQTWGTFRYWEVVVPPNALGWDVRVKDVTGAGIPHLVIGRGFLPGIWETFFLGLPGNETNWFVGEQWAAASDWTRRQFSPTGATETGRLLAMGMGRPLEPGTYIVAVNNDTIVGTADSSYTLLSRGIGPGFSIPVVDLDFYSGISSHAGLEAREAAYYRVEIPPGAPSWRVKVSTNVGEAMLVLLSNNIPNVDSGRPSYVGKFMQKAGSEHYVLLPTNGQSQLPGGTYYLAVVSEGTNVSSATRVGVGHTSFTIQSLGPMGVENLGVVAAGSDLLYSVPSQEGGETRGFQFTVPSGISSLQVRLDNRIGNPVMVVRHGSEFPDPSAVGTGFPVDEYGDQGGYQVISTTTNAAAGGSLVTLANPPPGTYSMVVKVRAVSGIYSNASYTVRISALAFTDLAFDCGAAPITNHLAGTWRYFRIEVPTNALGWDVRLGGVSNGTPRLVVRRDALPSSLGTSGWGQPADNTNWPSGNQWAANADWTARPNSAAAVNENFRILAMGMGQPLEAGTYYVGVNNTASTTNLSYTITSRGIGAGMCLPVTDLAFNGGTVTNTGMVPREAAYYRIQVPSNSPSLKVRVASTGGELMVLAFTGKIPSVDSGRNNNPGKVMQKAGNEHYVLLPDPGQSVLIPGPVYLAVVSEGVNPASANQVGFGTSSFVITCFGGVPIHNLGTVGPTDLVKVDSLDGGESKAYQFVVPLGVALEARLENRIGNPVMELKNGAQLPDPGQAAPGFAQDVYGNEGGQLLATVTTNNITLPSPTNGTYSLVVKARSVAGAYPDAQYTVRVRQGSRDRFELQRQFEHKWLDQHGQRFPGGQSTRLFPGDRAVHEQREGRSRLAFAIGPILGSCIPARAPKLPAGRRCPQPDAIHVGHLGPRSSVSDPGHLVCGGARIQFDQLFADQQGGLAGEAGVGNAGDWSTQHHAWVGGAGIR